MSGDTTPAPESPSKPLLTIATPPIDDDASAATRCCGGGSCSLS